MGRLHKALDDRKVRSKKAGFHADGGGLYLNVTPGGARSWILRTMVRGGRRVEMGLGSYPEVSLAEAREEATRYRKVARDGADPVAERDRRKASTVTFEQAARKVHEAHKPTWKDGKHPEQWLNTLATHVFPVFGDKSVALVDQGDVLAALGPIWIKTPETARRVRQRIKTVLDWAIAAQHRAAANPVTGIERALPKQRRRVKHHKALPYAEAPTFLAKLREGGSADATKLGLELLVLTAARTSEVLEATWGEFDLQAGVWTIPEGRMKAQREHRVPLSKRARQVLAEAKKLHSRSEYVFPGRGGVDPLSNMAFTMAVRRLGYPVTVHGFRSSFRDWAAERTNYSRDVAEAALAHAVEDRTEAAYRRTDYFDQRIGLMDAWARFLSDSSAKVVPFRRPA